MKNNVREWLFSSKDWERGSVMASSLHPGLHPSRGKKMMRLLPEKNGTMYYLRPKNNTKDKIDEDIINNMVGNKKKEAQAKREHYM